MRRTSRIAVAFLLFVLGLVMTTPASAGPVAGSFFGSTWAYTDQPVESGQIQRTWMWGPEAASPSLFEPYAESPSGQRLVQYFDKTRMEITHPNGDQTSIWYVTNGLLAEELITGRLQLGDNIFQQHEPAQVNVAGDTDDPNGPTYATFNKLMGFGAIPSGWKITQTVDRAGTVGDDAGLASYDVSAQDVGSPTHHNVASVFWAFMNSSGTVFQNGGDMTAKLFTNPFYATGYPLTEAYWTSVLVGGVKEQVLVQVFERRVLTYTPGNPDGWKVEAGNVGQHYYTWRYTELGETATVDAYPPPPWGATSSTLSFSEMPYNGSSRSASIVVANTVSGSCVTASVAVKYRNDAWRCSTNGPTNPTGASLFDPCFSPAVLNPSEVACPVTLRSQEVVIIQLTQPLPSGNAGGAAGRPWAIQLSNSKQCFLNTGVSPAQGALIGRYDCGDGWYVETNTVDETTAKWSALLQFPLPGTGGTEQQMLVTVDVAWY